MDTPRSKAPPADAQGRQWAPGEYEGWVAEAQAKGEISDDEMPASAGLSPQVKVEAEEPEPQRPLAKRDRPNREAEQRKQEILAAAKLRYDEQRARGDDVDSAQSGDESGDSIQGDQWGGGGLAASSANTSRKSSSRPERQRGPKRGAKKLAKLIAHITKEFVDPDGMTVFVPGYDEEGKPMRRKATVPEFAATSAGVIIRNALFAEGGTSWVKVLDEKGQPIYGKQKTYDGTYEEVAKKKETGLWETSVRQRDSQEGTVKGDPLSEEDLCIWIKNCMLDGARGTATGAPVGAKWIVKKRDANGEWFSFCEMCNKNADGQHEISGLHKLKVEEDAIYDTMAGDASSRRRHEPGGVVPGFLGFVSKGNLRNWWGAALDHMTVRGMEEIRKKGVFYVDGKKKYPIRAEDVLDMRMAVVSYNGMGKYTAESKFYWYDALPDDQASAEAPGSTYRWPTPDGNPHRLPDGHGWWPVLAPRLREGILNHFWQAQEITIDKKKMIIVICFYQILDDDIVGWWVYIDIYTGQILDVR